jgi:hypothetical protein
MCAVTRWTDVTWRQRIVTCADPNFLLGHWSNHRGAVYDSGWLTPSEYSYGTPNDWLVVCAKNAGTTPNNVLIDGVPHGSGLGGTEVTGQLGLNVYSDALENSNFAFSQLMIWNITLSDSALVEVSDSLINFLATGYLSSTKQPTPELTISPTVAPTAAPTTGTSHIRFFHILPIAHYL